MVPLIARQSVIIKCNSKKSVLLGNYEFYYAAGLLKQLCGLQADAGMEPAALHAALMEQVGQLSPEDERERYLIRLVMNYDPSPKKDGQMEELFCMGEQETAPWELHAGAE